MKKWILLLALTSATSASFANDGGIAAIKVDQIKMRETAFKNGQEVLVKKIALPRYQITLEGGEAAKLQKILPSQSSVLTSVQPEIKGAYEESFKSLGIYSDKSKEATSKVIDISCSDAEIKTVPGKTSEEETYKVVKTGKTVCTITIEGSEDDMAPIQFGDMMEFNPKTCK